MGRLAVAIPGCGWEGIAGSKIADFAGEAPSAADADMMRKVRAVEADGAVGVPWFMSRGRGRVMIWRRCSASGWRRSRSSAKAELAELREQEKRKISERLIISYRSVLGCLDPRSSETPDAARGAAPKARRIVGGRRRVRHAAGRDRGGLSASRKQLHAVGRKAPPAGPGDDVRVHDRLSRAGGDERRSQRAGPPSSTPVAHAHLDPRLHPRPSRRCPQVDLSFASEQWQRTLLDRGHPGQVHRRLPFEACVFTYLAERVADRGYRGPRVPQAYANWAAQLLRPGGVSARGCSRSSAPRPALPGNAARAFTPISCVPG